jgi:hypothetical protein
MMKGYQILLASIITISLLATTSQAASEYVYTELFFNIGAVDEMTVTLLGESSVTSSEGGTATPANIEFNVSGDAFWENATVTGGGSTQDSSNAILELDNTGTTNLEINISINATLPAATCTMGLKYNTTWTGTPDGNATDVGTTNITLDSSFTPAESVIDIWLWGNFTGCGDGDDTVRRFFMWATTV